MFSGPGGDFVNLSWFRFGATATALAVDGVAKWRGDEPGHQVTITPLFLWSAGPSHRTGVVTNVDGSSIGKGHLAEAKAALNAAQPAPQRAQSGFSRREEEPSHEAD